MTARHCPVQRIQYLDFGFFSLYFRVTALPLLKYRQNSPQTLFTRMEQRAILLILASAQLAKVTGSLHLHTF